MPLKIFWLVAAIVSAVAPSAQAQTGLNVLVVANDAAPGSLDIAQRYAAARQVPDSQVLRVTTRLTSEIARTDFESTIQTPIAAWLAAGARQDRILYIVLTRGIPVRIAGSAGRNGTVASVDSELALLYRRMTGAAVVTQGPIANPYYAVDPDVTQPIPFSHATHDIYLVTRLDGFTVADAVALVARGAVAGGHGRFVLDAPPPTGRDPRTLWFEAAAARLTALHAPVVQETTSRALEGADDVLGYFSWGSNDPALRVRVPRVTFAPGAIAAMFLSTDARTFAEPPSDWTPGEAGTARAFDGSTQSLVGDLVRAGVTGMSGQVAEPYLDGAVRPDVLFPSYVQGYNLAESFYRALPYLSWQTVVVGDPLCAPFRSFTLPEADPPVDPETELPIRFSARRLAVVGTAVAPEAVKHLVRGESRMARSDRTGAIDAFREAVAADKTLVPAWRLLGGSYEAEGRYAEANDAYRTILALDPKDVIALNNLAYNLAVRDRQPQDALPLAVRAAALVTHNPIIDDTLGWVYHLVGNAEEALRLIPPAARALPGNAEVQLHAAVVYAASGRLDEAAKALESAGNLDAVLKERAEFQEVQRLIRRDR